MGLSGEYRAWQRSSVRILSAATPGSAAVDSETADSGTAASEAAAEAPSACGLVGSAADRDERDELARRRNRRLLGGSARGGADGDSAARDAAGWAVESGTAPNGVRISAMAPLDAGHVVVAHGPRGTLEKWAVAGPDRHREILGRHGGPVTSMVAADDAIVTTGIDRRVVRWSPARPAAAGTPLGVHRAGVTAAAVLADARVVTSGHDCRITVWNVSSQGGEGLALGVHKGGVNALAASVLGQVASAGHDGRVLVWNLVKAQHGPVEIRGLRSWTLAMTFLDDGRLVTVSGPQGEVWVWDVSGGGAVGERLGRHGDWVISALALSQARFVTVGGTGIGFWDPAGQVSQVRRSVDGGGWGAACVLGGDTFAAGGENGVVLRGSVRPPAGRQGPVDVASAARGLVVSAGAGKN